MTQASPSLDQPPKRPARRPALSLPSGLMPLVDIFLATLGVFIVVLASQELVEDIPKVEVAAEAVVLCKTAQDMRLVFADPDRDEIPLGVETLAAALNEQMPRGGNVIVAIPDSCTQGSPSGFQKLLTLDAAMSAVAGENVFFRFRFVPTGDGEYSGQALAQALVGQGSWPPINEVQ